MKAVLLLFLATLLSACVVSETALAPLAPLAPDHPLVGTWVMKTESETAYLHIGNDEKGLKLVHVELDRQGRVKSEAYAGSATRVEGTDYLSLEMAVDGNIRFFLCKYRITGDGTLQLWSPDSDYLVKAVNVGEIAGTAKPGALVPTVLLTAKEEVLRQFFARHQAKIFIKAPTVFRRVG